MKLAEGKPLRRKMMAAMAQQDCGQCGYNCNDYSDVIASRSETRLNLCVPGGQETARMLKALYEELDKAPAAASSATSAPGGAGGRRPAARAVSRDNPAPATFGRPPKNCSTSRAPKRKPGTSTSICPAPVSIMSSAICSASSPRNELGNASTTIIALLGASHTTERLRQDAARRVARRRPLAGAGAGSACSNFDFVHHRRRAQREKARALAQGEETRWRCRDAGRDGGVAKIL